MSDPLSDPVHLPMLVIETTAHLRARTAANKSAAAGTAAASAPSTTAPAEETVSGVVLVLPSDSRANIPAAIPADLRDCRMHLQGYQAGLTRGGDLTAAIATLIQSQGLKPSDVASLGVNIGPGSWTGLRVGLTAAKTLAATAPLPLIAIEGLFASALDYATGFLPRSVFPVQAGSTDTRIRIVVIQDSGHGKICRGMYQCDLTRSNHWPETLESPRMLDAIIPAELFGPAPGVLLGLDALPPATRAAWDTAVPALPPGWTTAPRPRGLQVTARACVTAARRGRLIFSAGQVQSLSPLYLKDPYSA